MTSPRIESFASRAILEVHDDSKGHGELCFTEIQGSFLQLGIPH